MMHTYLSEARLTLLVLFFLFFQVPISQAQSPTVTLVGKVTDQKTGQALPFANVFINNSSIGTTTDEHGAYKLVNLPIGSMEVAVSFLGYTTIKQTLRYETGGVKTVPFQMREGMELEGVTIYSRKSKKRERYLKIIAKELLGQGRFSKQCRLVNPEVLRIRMEDNGHLTAQTRSPLIIENLALGYIIHQDLDDFDFYEGRVYYGGSTRFELLDPKTDQQKAEWRANQKEAYKGSLKQVLTAMVADSLSEYGFRVFQEIPESLRMFSEVRYVNGQNPLRNHLNNRILEVRGAQLIQPGELPTERLVVSQTKLEIFDMNKKGRSPYTDISRAYTQITLPNGYFIITPEGWVVMPMGFEIAGDLGSDRFSNLLPADWKRD